MTFIFDIPLGYEIHVFYLNHLSLKFKNDFLNSTDLFNLNYFSNELNQNVKNFKFKGKKLK